MATSAIIRKERMNPTAVEIQRAEQLDKEEARFGFARIAARGARLVENVSRDSGCSAALITKHVAAFYKLGGWKATEPLPVPRDSNADRIIEIINRRKASGKLDEFEIYFADT